MTNTHSTTIHADLRSSSDGEPLPRQSRAARNAWIALGGVIALASLGWGTFSVISLLAHREYTQRESFPAAEVTALEVRNAEGSVRVIATPGDQVTVIANVSDGWRPTGVSSSVTDGVLELRGTCPALVDVWCSVDYVIEIPADRPVTINAADGVVVVRGVTATVDVDNDDGGIELEDLSGNIQASNDNGRIVGRRLSSAVVDASNRNGRIELSFAEAPQLVAASTANGRIDVVVPDDEFLYRVEMNTSNGGTDNLVRTDPNSDRVIDLSTRNGSITVRPPG